MSNRFTTAPQSSVGGQPAIISPQNADGTSADPTASTAAAVTKSDTDVLATTKGLWIGTGGDVAVTMAGGGNVTFVNVPDGTILPIRVTKVLSTGTDASDIVALR